ncbi:Velvet factor [Pleurostoma richardsiae]|uniref:Velvet factor n=1 Tax=Pleurostoma richardsiae TaxID=41990 RepID=A0AA38RHQ0_9PEZI|nr:Velvet factor [Pleurostoma richardsiae]
MSTIVQAVPHSFGHTMPDAMAGPLNGWLHEPSYAPRNGYYPQDHQISQGERLPGPSSLLSGPPPPPTVASGRDYVGSKSGYYSDFGTPSPIQPSPPQLPLAGSNSHQFAMQRRLPSTDVRLSPTQSSTASDRSDEIPDIARLRQRHMQTRQQVQARVPRLHDPLQLRRDREISRRPFPAPSGRPIIASQTTSPPSHSMPSPRPEPKSMSIANLLSGEDRTGSVRGDSKAPAHPIKRDTTEYKITVRQQPVAARSCGFGERDRRVIDPPPIVQLVAENPEATAEELKKKIRVNSAVVHCSIWNEAGDQDNSAMPEDYRQQRRLMGTLVSSPFVGLDENGKEGCFFCFPDLSCRTPGSFRLKFALIIIDVTRQRPGSSFPIVATAMSDVFTVYNAKDFPGMTASTALTKRLKEQGCLISIKKGNEKTNAARAREDSEDEDEEEGSSAGRTRKRARRS